METSTSSCHQMARMVASSKWTGLETEGHIIEAYLQLKQPLLYGSGSRARVHDMLSAKGSIITLIRVYKAYVSEAAPNKKAWCIEHGLNSRTLEQLYSKVVAMQTEHTRFPGEDAFTDDAAKEKGLIKSLLETYRDHVWMYRGHKTLGYINIHSGVTARIDTSLLSNNKQLPEFILCLPGASCTKQTHFVAINREMVTENDVQNNSEVDYSFMKEPEVTCLKLENIAPEALSIFSERSSALVDILMDALPDDIDKKLVFIERNLREGSLQIYAPKEHILQVKQSVTDIMDRQLQKTADFTKVLPYISADTGIRVSVGIGIEVKHVLLPQEVTEAIVLTYKNSDVPTRAEIETILGKYKIESLVENPDQPSDHGQRRGLWGKVTFGDPDAAADAMNQYKFTTFPSGKFFLKPVCRNSAFKQNFISFSLLCCRRPWRKDIDVTICNPEDPDFINRVERLKINGVDYKVSKQYPDESMSFYNDEIKLTLYSPDEPKGDFNERAFNSELSKRLCARVTAVKRTRTPPRYPYSGTVRSFRQTIERYIDSSDCVTSEDYEVHAHSPDKEDIYISATVTLRDTVDVDELKKKLLAMNPTYNNQKMSIPDAITLVERIPRNAWAAVQEGVKIVQDTVQKRQQEGETVEDVIQKDGSRQIRISCNVLRRGIAVRNTIRKVTRPGVVSDLSDDDVNMLRNKDGHTFLRRVMNHFVVHVTVRAESAVVLIYGPPNQITAAKNEIMRYLASIKHNCDTWTVGLASYKSASISTTALVSAVQDRFDTLRCVNGIKELRLERSKAVLQIVGSSDGYISVKRRLNAIIRDLRRQILADTDDIKRLCSVCFCPPREPVYRLRRCGHKYCDDCIKMHLNTAINDRVFPVRCVRDGCTAGVTWHDLELIYDYNSAATQRILNASVTAFVAANKDRARFCQTPDCRGIYRVTADGKPFTCNECERTWCTRCHVPYHTGLACVMYKLMHQNAIEPKLKAWMLEDPSCRKICPKCENGIEKVSGCNNIHCSNCQACICWICLRFFSDSSKTYDHLNQVHGGYY